MPKRPPKNWFKRCTINVKKSSKVDNPGAVCGDLWYNKMSPKQKSLALKAESRGKRKDRPKEWGKTAEEWESYLAEEQLKAMHDVIQDSKSKGKKRFRIDRPSERALTEAKDALRREKDMLERELKMIKEFEKEK